MFSYFALPESDTTRSALPDRQRPDRHLLDPVVIEALAAPGPIARALRAIGYALGGIRVPRSRSRK